MELLTLNSTCIKRDLQELFLDIRTQRIFIWLNFPR